MASEPAWRVSTYTGGNGNCVEVAAAARTVVVRDTKDRGGVVLAVSADAWRRFAAMVRESDRA
jgi:Domain of unknown function (DUF397)